ncbi:MAG: hypothetical protein KGL94_12780 [Acidobacteriota bacterium]|nr:hypothetical protein [Acidobacteriota bacterium]
MPDTRLTRCVTALCVLGIAAGIQASAAAAGKPKPHTKHANKTHTVIKKAAPALAPGTYSGTVQMSGVTVGASTYQATLNGTWTITVDGKEHATGSESLQATVPFTSPDSSGCTYSPTSWTLTFNGQLGRDTVASGTPGTVTGGNLVISLSNVQSGGWSGSPDQYTRTCGSFPNQWPIDVVYGLGSSTGAPVEGAVRFPLRFFKTVGGTYELQVGTILNAKFTQTYALTSISR